MTIKRVALSLSELDILAQDMLTAALKVAENKLGTIDGDLAGTIFSDDWVQRKFRTFITSQCGENYRIRNKIL